MPGGVSSPVRSFAAVGSHPFFVERARGAELTDVDGNIYIDFVQSWGALLFGHSHPDDRSSGGRDCRTRNLFRDAERARGRAGSSRDRARSKCRTGEVRLVGDRGGDDRTKAGSRRNRSQQDPQVRRLLPRSLGRTLGGGRFGRCNARDPGEPRCDSRDRRGHDRGAPYNDLHSVGQALDEADGEVAAIIVEPVAANMGLVLPNDGFLAGLRQIADERGVLLIFDEVITGFRLGGRGRAGTIRGVGRPRDARQDPRRRPSGGGSRRFGRADGPAGPCGTHLSSRHVVGQSDRDGGRYRRADFDPQGPVGLRHASRTLLAPWSGVWSTPRTRLTFLSSPLPSGAWPDSSSRTTK